MDARRSLAVIRRWLWLLIASLLLAGGASFLVSSSLTKLYEARVTLIVGQSLQSTSPDYNQLLASQRLSQTYADLVTTGPLLTRVIDKESLDATPEELRALVKADAPRDSTLVTITVTDPDPIKAASIANTIADELIASSPALSGRNSDVQQFVDQDLQAAQRQIQDTEAEVQRLSGLQTRTADQETQLQSLQGRLVQLRQTYATLLGFSSTSGSNLLTIVDPALPPAEASSPRVLLNTLLAALVGLMLAVGVAFLVEYLDDTLKSPDDVEAVAGLPTLGTIIRMKGDEGRSPIYSWRPSCTRDHRPRRRIARCARTSSSRAWTSPPGPSWSRPRSRVRARPPRPPISPRCSPRPATRRCWWTRTSASPACTGSSTYPTRPA